MRRHKDQRARTRQDSDKGKDTLMTDAQIGLLVATPVIIGFASMLYRMGVLQGAGTVSAVGASVVIAAVLFFGQ